MMLNVNIKEYWRETKIFTKYGQRIHSDVMLFNFNTDGSKNFAGLLSFVLSSSVYLFDAFASWFFFF